MILIRIRKSCLPPGTGSVSQRYGSGSFHRQANMARKTLISTVLCLTVFRIFYLWRIRYVYLQKGISKIHRRSFFLLASWRSLTKRIRTLSQRYGSTDLDPYQNITDSEHWYWFWWTDLRKYVFSLKESHAQTSKETYRSLRSETTT